MLRAVFAASIPLLKELLPALFAAWAKLYVAITSKITGILIAPGQEFSTANTIGEVTEEEGFVKEYVITGGQTVKELGGGLCQLATTLFRMALNTGLPITERVNHAYVIPYYGPGLDATVYGPHPDFRFVNDTGNYILLQGTAKNNEVILT